MLKRYRKIAVYRINLYLVSLFLVVASMPLEAIADDSADNIVEANLDSSSARPTMHFINTDSPRDTLNSFIRLSWILESAMAIYDADQSSENFDRLTSLAQGMIQLIDLSEIPKASRSETGLDTVAHLLDIIGRVDLPPLKEVPGENAYSSEGEILKWRIPGTPVVIAEMDSGKREGEFLFNNHTVEVAPWFFKRIRHLPLRSTLGIESWNETLHQFHGPAIPSVFVSSLPKNLKKSWLDTPVWKIILVLLLAAISIWLLAHLKRIVHGKVEESEKEIYAAKLITPVSIIATTMVLRVFISDEINVSGRFARFVDLSTTLIIYISGVWVFWLATVSFSEKIIRSPKIPEGGLDANLLRLLARVVGFVMGVVILAYGAQDLGLPVVGLVAGLGVGGLAVALAIRPTLENLIGGAILYIDKPVRIGDFCSFGTFTGTVENIGVRSTMIRTLDRTLITVPNANFANMEIVNWASCDKMKIQTTIGLRYETDPDQLRFLLAKLREMCYSHPRIDRDTVRIRFHSHGASSLDVDFRVYALTREWNDYYAIREDVLLRVNDIVAEAGTGFAFPSRTVYMSQDNGLDSAQQDNAIRQVSSWRQRGELPFPDPSDESINRILDKLEYPPAGSFASGSSGGQSHTVAEPLSSDSDNPEDEEEKDQK